jgi:hypothetical protein
MWCIFQKKVVKNNAALLKIIKLDTHVVIFQKKLVKDNATLLKIVETSTKDVFLKVKKSTFARYTWKVKQRIKATVQLKEERKSSLTYR